MSFLLYCKISNKYNKQNRNKKIYLIKMLKNKRNKKFNKAKKSLILRRIFLVQEIIKIQTNKYYNFKSSE